MADNLAGYSINELRILMLSKFNKKKYTTEEKLEITAIENKIKELEKESE